MSAGAVDPLIVYVPYPALHDAIDRDRLAGSKYLVTAAAAVVAALAVEVVAMVCLLLFGRGKFEITAALFAVLGGGLLAAACWAVIGTGLGLLLRSPALAVGAEC